MNSFLRHSSFLILLIMISLLVPQQVPAQEWPALRGATGVGAATSTNGILTKTSEVELKVGWKIKIGSGYSSVVVSNERVIAMYSLDDKDVIGCFDAKDGRQVWVQEIGPRFVGENGSFDGPISTPCIANQNVFALSPLGKLFCITLDQGKLLWSRDLAGEMNVKKPLYGFASSPIFVSDMLVMQLGGENQSLIGLDPKDGSTQWSVGTDSINSQSPTVANLFGKTVVLAAGGKKLIGVQPESGKQVFEHEHGAGNGGAMVPVMIENDQVLLTLDDAHSRAFSIRPGDEDSLNVSQEWENRSIKNTYNIPVLYGDHVYAYSTRILTCVDRKNGRAVWKQRKPGDGFLIVVDGHLVISTKKGGLVLSKATPEGYAPICSNQVFDDLVWSVPAFSNDAIFVRSLGELARVDIVARDAGQATEKESALPMSPTVQQLVEDLTSAQTDEAKAKIVDAFFESHQQMPFTEGNVAHFFYRGNGTDVAVSGDSFGSRQEVKMNKITGTDLFHHSIELEEDQRMNYVFFVDYKPVLDPLNPRKTTSSVYAGEMEFAMRLSNAPPLQMSWFGMPKWKRPSYLSQWPDELSGQLVDHVVELPRPAPADSDADDETKEDKNENEEATDAAPTLSVKVYLPPGHADSDKRFPVAYVFDGSTAIKQQFPQAIDKLFSERPELASIVVFVDGRTPDFPKLLAEQIVPSIDKAFKTEAKRESRVCVGFGFAATLPLMATAQFQDTFGATSADSPLVFDDAQRMLESAMANVNQPTQVRLSWGRFEMFNPDENWDMRKSADQVAKIIQKNENLKLSGGMVNDSTDWSSWENRYHEIFELLK